jgi:regulator of sirC expression with transglutaminase-like and TPR domain
MHVEGVGLPGHFIARAVDGPRVVLFDPFHGGRRLTIADCEELVEQATGQPFEATSDTLASTPPGPVLRRVLTNLKGVYLRQNDFVRSARVTRRILQLEPGNAPELRDLGVCLMHAGHPGEAINLLVSYLEAKPAASDAGIVRRLLKNARAEVAKWN